MKPGSVPIVLLAGEDEEHALTAMLRLWHRTARRHRLHIANANSMPTLRRWAHAHAVPFLNALTTNVLLELADTGPIVIVESDAKVPVGWMALLNRAAGREPHGARDGDFKIVWLNNARSHLTRDRLLTRAAQVVEAIKKARFEIVRFAEEDQLQLAGVPCSQRRVLTIIHDAGGGAVRTSEDLCSALAKAGPWQPWLLRCGLLSWRLEWFSPDGVAQSARRLNFSRHWRMDMGDAEREESYAHLLADLAPHVVHVRHLLGTGNWLLQRTSAAGVPIVFSHHDYYAACPNVELLDATGACCFGNCQLHFATPSHGPDCEPTGIWESPRPMLRLRPDWRTSWIGQLSAAFVASKCVHVTTSAAARDILLSTFPGISNFHIIPHGRDVVRIVSCVSVPPATDCGVLSLGHLTPSKGSDLLLQIARENVAAGSPFTFHHLGDANNAAELESCGVRVHGRYDREKLADILVSERFSFGLLCPIWPETFSHTLTEMWGLGLPVVASAMGAIGERVAAAGAGWLLDPTQPGQWLPQLMRIAQNPADWQRAADAVSQIRQSDTATMAGHYAELYLNCLHPDGTDR